MRLSSLFRDAPQRPISGKRLLVSCALMVSASVACQAETVIHWTNSASQDGITVLNASGVFTSDFKGSNDIQVSKLTGPASDIFTETFGGSTPGNNPLWVTNFIGNAAQQTGDGTPGRWSMLEPSSSAGSFRFDFSIPLGPGDRMLIADVDQSEKYQIKAYTLVGGNYVPAAVTGWGHQAYSGQTGVIPDARWAVWAPADGTLTSTGNSLGEPLDVLAPDQSIDRVEFINFGGGGGTPAIQFAANIAQVDILGDYNHNGIVDSPDYVLWRNGLGTNYVQSDYGVWRSHFGETAGSGSGVIGDATAVPEPGAMGLMSIGAAIGYMLRRDRRWHGGLVRWESFILERLLHLARFLRRLADPCPALLSFAVPLSRLFYSRA